MLFENSRFWLLGLRNAYNLSTSPRRYFHNLDVIRFLAALWVVSAHYGHIGPTWGKTGFEPASGWLDTFFKFGSLGVCIFFILSGFVIAHLTNTTKPIKFGLGRVIRLMPGFWASMTLSTILIYALGSDQIVDVTLWLTNLTLIPQLFGQSYIDGTYWTLLYEFVFYGWVFIFLFAGVFHKYLLEISGIWLLISYFNLFLLHSNILERVFITYYSGAFVAGLVLWHGMTHRYRFLHYMLLLVSMSCLAYGVQDINNEDFLKVPFEPPTLLIGIFCSLFSLAIVAAGIYLPQIQYKKSIIATLGAISYPLYLFHQEVGYAILRHLSVFETPVVSAIFVTIIMVFLALAIHLTLEKPLQAFLGKLVKAIE